MLGTRIAALRREAGLSQAELAQRLQVSPSALGMYEQERREPSMQTLVKLSRELGVSRTTLREAIRELAAADQKEIEELTQRAEEAEANLEARSRVLEDKNSKIDQLTEEVAKIKKRVKALPPADVGEEIRKEVTKGMGKKASQRHMALIRRIADAHGVSADYIARRAGKGD